MSTTLSRFGSVHEADEFDLDTPSGEDSPQGQFRSHFLAELEVVNPGGVVSGSAYVNPRLFAAMAAQHVGFLVNLLKDVVVFDGVSMEGAKIEDLLTFGGINTPYCEHGWQVWVPTTVLMEKQNVVLFQVGSFRSGSILVEFEKRNLKPADPRLLAKVNFENRSLSLTHPNTAVWNVGDGLYMLHFEEQGGVRIATFTAYNGEPVEGRWYAGVPLRKNSGLYPLRKAL